MFYKFIDFKPTFLFLVFVAFGFVSCQTKVPDSTVVSAIQQVVAIVETEPMPTSGDAADDPAIWINYADVTKSLIVGTNKKSGLSVFKLDGKLIHHFPVGRINNVDIRQGFRLGNQKVDLVAGSNRTDNTVLLMSIDSTGELKPVLKSPVQSSLKEVYGFCLYHSIANNKYYAFVNGKSGQVEQWELLDAGNNLIEGKLARTFAVNGQPEGCVADDETGLLYLGEEDKGVWRFNAEPGNDNKGFLIDSVGAGRLIADVEGVTIWYGKQGQGYLLVSSQGNNTFAVYERQGSNKYIGSFAIVDGQWVDGVAETDGIDVTSVNLGARFPKGVFIAQDGFNTDAGNPVNQNFKLVSWASVDSLLLLN